MTELVSVNKMGVPNIAMIFGPTLMSNESVSIVHIVAVTKVIEESVNSW